MVLGSNLNYCMSNFTPQAAWRLTKSSAREFMKNNSFRLAAALAYNTIFSLPPLLIIIMVAAGSIFGEEALSGQLYTQTKGALGASAAEEIQTMINSFNQHKSSGLASVIGIATLVFAATTFFVTLQDSLNTIWNIKLKPETGFAQTIKARFLSFGLILSVALLMLVSFLVSAALVVLTDYLKNMFPDITVYLLKLLDFVLSVGIITLLFALIYKYLPDAIIRWKDVWPGAFITAVLFVIGKFLISWYIGHSDVGSAYGAAGSIIVILVWVYYSALIVFFGAEFTQEFARHYGENIRAKPYAVHYEIREISDEEHQQEHAGRPASQGSFRK